jgi:hypothetical protein
MTTTSLPGLLLRHAERIPDTGLREAGARVRRPPEGRDLITVAVGPSLDPVLLSLEGPPDYRAEAGTCSFPKQRVDRPNRYRVHYLADDDCVGIDLPPTFENYHAVQPLPRGTRTTTPTSYYCTDFPLVRLLDRRLAGSWMMTVHGSRGFAVDGKRVLLGGSYDQSDALFLGALDQLDFQEFQPVG